MSKAVERDSAEISGFCAKHRMWTPILITHFNLVQLFFLAQPIVITANTPRMSNSKIKMLRGKSTLAVVSVKMSELRKSNSLRTNGLNFAMPASKGSILSIGMMILEKKKKITPVIMETSVVVSSELNKNPNTTPSVAKKRLLRSSEAMRRSGFADKSMLNATIPIPRMMRICMIERASAVRRTPVKKVKVGDGMMRLRK